ncbi:hypothetical protein [Thermodesulfatator atlanticus]
MKKEYDFSRGVRGKFYNDSAELLIPIYLDFEVQEKIKKMAQKKNVELRILVNELLKKELEKAGEL